MSSVNPHDELLQPSGAQISEDIGRKLNKKRSRPGGVVGISAKKSGSFGIDDSGGYLNLLVVGNFPVKFVSSLTQSDTSVSLSPHPRSSTSNSSPCPGAGLLVSFARAGVTVRKANSNRQVRGTSTHRAGPFHGLEATPVSSVICWLASKIYFLCGMLRRPCTAQQPSL
jgi:hypothetical protein